MFEINPVLVGISAASVAAASALIGSLLVFRKMTLISDSLSHVALPGIAAGILFHFNPLMGGILFLAAAILLIWGIQWRTALSFESVIGVFFVASLALGSLLIPEEDILEAFFGDISAVTAPQAVIQIVIALAVIAVTAYLFKKFVLISIAPDLAYSVRTSRSAMDFLFLALVALTITIGISFVGVLLMSSLLIIPAVVARNLARTLREYVAVSIAIGVASLGGGIVIANSFPAVHPGIATVLVGTLLFTASLFFRRRS
ncbi:MAG: metal ABC transporter permease [Candidatus Liptonbacteria bacterium]|nr:metal ABC transporter permease [Candidatus Liptonbacteria bacterium]